MAIVLSLALVLAAAAFLIWSLFAGGDGGLSAPPTVGALIAIAVLVIVQPVSAISFLVWVHRARANLDILPGADPQWSRGWAVGAWFIPLGSYVLGPLVVADISRATYTGRSGRAPAGLLVALWLLFTGPGVVALATGAAVPNSGGTPLIRYLGLPGLAATVVGMLCLLVAVNSVTRAQHDLLGA